MFSNLTCAFSGAFLIAGGMSMAVWSKLFNFIHTLKRKAYCPSLHSCAIDASPDLLGRHAREKVLLLGTRPRLVCGRGLFRRNDHSHWSLLPIRGCLSCQLAGIYERLLGSVACDRRCCNDYPIGNVSTIHSFLGSLTILTREQVWLLYPSLFKEHVE